jgi:hypothetical protein
MSKRGSSSRWYQTQISDPFVKERERQGLRSRSRCVLAVECYPGVHVDEVRRVLTDGLRPTLVVDARQAYKDAAEVERLCAPHLGDDPVFGRMNGLRVADFVDASRAAVQRGRIDKASTGLVLVGFVTKKLTAMARNDLPSAGLATRSRGPSTSW